MDAEAKTNEWQVFKEPYNNWVHKLQNVFHKFTTSKWFWITSHYPHESCVAPDPENIIQNTRSIQVFTIWSESNLLSWKKKRPKEKEKINRKEDPISLFWWARKKTQFLSIIQRQWSYTTTRSWMKSEGRDEQITWEKKCSGLFKNIWKFNFPTHPLRLIFFCGILH